MLDSVCCQQHSNLSHRWSKAWTPSQEGSWTCGNAVWLYLKISPIADVAFKLMFRWQYFGSEAGVREQTRQEGGHFLAWFYSLTKISPQSQSNSSWAVSGGG